LGKQPWKDVSAGYARQRLRRILDRLGVQNAHEYGLHDLRRGHAEDLRRSGAPLKVILEAGQWTSPRFLNYLNLDELERDLVIEAHVAESDEED